MQTGDAYAATPELRARLTVNLAGFELAPPLPAGLRRAAVAVAVVAREDGAACFVLTERAQGLRNHAGQWAFPGGRLDPGEAVEAAALRELEEEVGLRLDHDFRARPPRRLRHAIGIRHLSCGRLGRRSRRLAYRPGGGSCRPPLPARASGPSGCAAPDPHSRE